MNESGSSWDQNQPSPGSSRSSTPSPTPPFTDQPPLSQPLLAASPVTVPSVSWSAATPSSTARSELREASTPIVPSQKRQMSEKDDDSGAGTLTVVKKQRMQNLELASRKGKSPS